MTVDHKMKNHRCPECGCGTCFAPFSRPQTKLSVDPEEITADAHIVYTLNFQGDPHLLEDGHGHHH